MLKKQVPVCIVLIFIITFSGCIENKKIAHELEISQNITTGNLSSRNEINQVNYTVSNLSESSRNEINQVNYTVSNLSESDNSTVFEENAVLAGNGSNEDNVEKVIVPVGPLPPLHCTNNIKDNYETDVDCGGDCPIKCGDGKSCKSDTDCAATKCISGICKKVPGKPGLYTDYSFYDINTTDIIEIYLTWLIRPPENVGIYAAFTFSFEAGQGGYIGLQRDGSLPKDRAIFSIWSINDSSHTAHCVSTGFNESDILNCEEGETEGNFGQALGMYDWVPGREYRIRVESIGTDEKGELWRGTITDMRSNVTTEIGTIHLDNVKGYIGYGKLRPNTAVFLEYYYGHSGYCDENNVHSMVMWRGPYINGKLADRGYTWYPLNCMYSRQWSPERGVIIHEAGGRIAWENRERDFWN
ncbi:MAG: hypothetical protein QXT45_02770 [Candidatus Bilamarchaeaceae archaeon]